MREDSAHCVAEDDEYGEGLAGRDRFHSFEGFPKNARCIAEFVFVSRFDQSFGRMAERSVPDIVQEGSKSRSIPVLRPDLWYVHVAVVAEVSSMSGVSLKGADHALRSFYDTP